MSSADGYALAAFDAFYAVKDWTPRSDSAWSPWEEGAACDYAWSPWVDVEEAQKFKEKLIQDEAILLSL